MLPDTNALLLRTVRYLRPEQVVTRASFVLERRLLAARPRLLERRYGRQLAASLPTIHDVAPIWRWPPAPFDPGARASLERAREVQRGAFEFLNQSRNLPNAVAWSAPGSSRLWRFHLHYFAYAVDLAVAVRQQEADAYERLRTLVQDWLVQHPVGSGDPWHPFVASSRLLAWLVARDILRPFLARDPAFAAELRRAVLLHALYVDEHLEGDVGGNHLLKNATALLVAGCLFDGPRPRRWRERATRIFAAELPRQVLPDGGHYERSPMYHLLVLEDLLLALAAAGRRDLFIATPLAHAIRGMQRAAYSLVHPDGDIPLFNDAVLGEAPRPGALVGPSTAGGERALPETGYFLLPLKAPEPGGVLIADCGPPGPDDLPAHVHADALSFELSVGTRRVLVDGGMASYVPGPLRQHLRSTAAHNTVEVDGRDQSEVWGAFRVGRRARVRLERWEIAGDTAVLVGSHDGYATRGVRHERTINAVPGSGWRVLDTLYGAGSHTAVSRLRLHPSFVWRPEGEQFAATDHAGQVVLRVLPIGSPHVAVEEGVYAERFNQPRAVQVLTLRRTGVLPGLFGYWLLLPGGVPCVA